MDPAQVTTAEGVLWQKVDGRVVLLGMADSSYYSLDDVGSRMWEVLQECPDVSAAAERLCQVYEVDEETLRKDLEAFIARLADRGLLRVDA